MHYELCIANWLHRQPIGELVFRFEVGVDGFEHGGIQKAVAGQIRDVFVQDGGPLGGRFPFHAIVFGDFLEEFSHRDLLAGDVDPRRREILLQDLRDGRQSSTCVSVRAWFRLP